MTPAVAFTLTVSNPSTEHAIEASLLLSMPLAAQPATARIDDTGAPRTPDPAGTTPMLCKAGCDAAAACRAWSFDAAVPPAAGCALISGGVPLNVYSASVTSGIKGTWAGDSAAGTLTHDRAAVSPPLPPSPGPAPAPPPACNTAAPEAGVDIGGGVKLDTEVVAAGPAGIAACAVRLFVFFAATSTISAHFSRVFQLYRVPPHTPHTRRRTWALFRTHPCWVLIGACDPML